MRYLFTVLFLVLTTSAFAQTDSIFPSETGETLINSLQASYSVTNPLGYNGARDAMYSSIDNKNGQIIGVYSGFTITSNNRTDAFQKGINTEHTWPQGMFDRDEPMRGDIHHIFPTKIEVNGDRGSLPFGESPDNQTTTWYRNSSELSSIPTSNIDEYSELLSGSVFEVREDHKGNTARAIFYFWAIYQDKSDVADDATFFNGMKDVLLAWHDLDPVDQSEVDRSLGAESAQGNRNPFVHDTTLVRRAFFGGSGNPDPTLSNPLSGEIVNIQSDLFTVNYSDNGQQKSVQFNFDSGLTTEDPDGNSFTFTDYDSIEEAIVDWQEDQASSSGRKATKVTVESFGDTTTVVGSGSTNALIISGVFDGDLSGGTPKGVELFATENIEDLSVFALGSANNGGGSDGVELTLSGSLAAGDYLYVSTEETNFNVMFGFNPDLTDDMAVAINGNDAIELFYDSTKAFSGGESVVDLFGTISGSDASWNHSDGWAYRVDLTGPDGNTFVVENWTIEASAFSGASSNSNASSPMPIGTFETDLGTSNEDEFNSTDLPASVVLDQNYPNPFNPSTVITYKLRSSQSVSLAVYDQLGRRVAQLVNGKQSNGTHQLTFDASGLSSGVYFYRLKTETSLITKKMLLIK
ncbi:MAG: endonuclease [Balneola sp.]